MIDRVNRCDYICINYSQHFYYDTSNQKTLAVCDKCNNIYVLNYRERYSNLMSISQSQFIKYTSGNYDILK